MRRGKNNLNSNYEYLFELSESKMEIEATFIAIKYLKKSSITEIDNAVAELINADTKRLEERQDKKRSRSKFSYRIAWCRTYLKSNGFINNETRGVWKLTEQGKKYDKIFSEDNLIVQRIKSFRLESLMVKNDSLTIFDTSFFNETFFNKNCSYSMIIGKNGSGKSTLLRALTQIFLVITKNEEGIKFNKDDLDYDYYNLKYSLNENKFQITIQKKKSRFIIEYLKNNQKRNVKNIEYPHRMLAISNIVNDRFMFASNERYKYLGSRGSANGYFMGDFEKKASEHLNDIITSRKYNMLIKALKIMGYDAMHLSDKGREIDNDAVTYVSLEKKGYSYRLEQLSSGEKNILGIVLSIIAQGSSSCIILIDEPENSLHPNWQINLITQLDEILNELNIICHMIVATHSPMIFSGLPSEGSSVIVSEGTPESENMLYSHRFIDHSPYAWSVESILYQVFEIRTLRNYYVEQDLKILIEYLKDSKNINEKSIESFQRLDKIVLSEHDPLKNLLSKVRTKMNESR